MSAPHAQPTPLLVADVDGRQARVALAEPGFEPTGVDLSPCTSQDELIALLEVKRATFDGPVRGVAIAAPGPNLGGAIQLTHAAMCLEAAVIAERLGLPNLQLVNNFTARALAVPLLEPSALEPIGRGRPHRDAPIVAVGPSGTGVGMSILYPDGFVGWTAAAAEGGHVELAAADAREAQVVAALRDLHGYVSSEHVLSGQGALDVALAVSTLAGTPWRPADLEALRSAAEAGDPVASETFRLLSGWLGAICGNFVLTAGARSGAYIISDTVLAWGDHFDRTRARHRFEAKGRMSDYMGEVPLALVRHPNCGLLGLSTLVG